MILYHTQVTPLDNGLTVPGDLADSILSDTHIEGTMRRQMAVLLSGLAVACASEPTGPETAETVTPLATAVGAGSWITRAQYPVNVSDATSASISDASGRTTMYVIGGRPKCCGAGQVTDAVRAYDATANTWTARARIPVRLRSTNGAAELDGRIYVSGGFSRRWDETRQVWRLETLKSLYVYNPATDTWARKRDMPITTVNGASVGYQGKLYVATACYYEAPCPSGESVVWRYDPASDQWTKFAERPRDWWDVSAGLIGGKLYLVDEFTGALDILDLATGAWSSGPKRPYRACNAAATSLQAKLYLFGWCDDYPTDPETRDRGLVFDPGANAWTEATPAPITAGADASLAKVFVNGAPRLSLVEGNRPDNHYQFAPSTSD
jgi:N-acetylneuraminic acid mutarotase